MDLICRIAAPEQLAAVLEAGVDVVQCGFAELPDADPRTAQRCGERALEEALAITHAAGRRLYLAIDGPMPDGAKEPWSRAVDRAVALQVDALVVSDIGGLAYIAERHPTVRRHSCLPLKAADTAHIDFLVEAFDIQRVLLPAGFLVEEVVQRARSSRCEVEVAARATAICRTWMDADRTRPSLDMLGHFERLEAAGVAGLRLEGTPPGPELGRIIAGLRQPAASAA
jgi:putative protease